MAGILGKGDGMNATLATAIGTACGFALGLAISVAGMEMAHGYGVPMGWHIAMGCIMAPVAGLTAWAYVKGY
jgi:hypothetical protein